MAGDIEMKGGDRLRLTYTSPNVEDPQFANVLDLATFRCAGENGNIEVQVLDRDGWETSRVVMPIYILRALMACGNELLETPQVQQMALNAKPSALVEMRRFIHRSL
jgi:hypothetical protein